MKKKLKRYSVLLLWDASNGFGDTQTYYTFVKATSPAEAVGKAQTQAAKHWWAGDPDIDKDDLRERAKEFIPELVLNGWHKSVSLGFPE